MTTHELHCYDYVNQPYEIVRRELLADPQALFKNATSAGQVSRLHVKLGALELGAEIEIEIQGIDEKRDAFARPSTTVAIQARSQRRATLFPVLTAQLVIYPLSPTETQLELSGSYDPPFGLVGEAIDSVALHRIARESMVGFVREIATYLRRNLCAAQAMA